MLHDPNDKSLFPVLTPDQISECAALGEKVHIVAGNALFREGDGHYCCHVVVSGRLKISRIRGRDETLLAVHGPGQFTGELSMLTGGKYITDSTAVEDLDVIEICPSAFKKMLGSGSPTADVLLTAFAKRSQQVGMFVSQEEKLAALGKMSAGLAHELNNPAAAARRASSLMLEAVFDMPKRMMTVEKGYSKEQREAFLELSTELEERAHQECLLDPLERSDREQDLLDWLDQFGGHGIEELAATLACSGVTSADLERWSGKLGATFLKGLFWMEMVMRLGALARDIETSTGRIRELVLAMKEYTYMDQAKFQEVDIHHGLDNTIKILHHKLKKGVEVKREYGANIPKICAYAGELNQVWTNIIDNAIDAMDGKGLLTIRTSVADGRVLVQICDSGVGIPEDVQRRIFEPFFTTKPVGEGTGLGLDISHRIITYRHGGEIQVRSQPGSTCFDIYLLLNPPKELELVHAGQHQESYEKTV